MERVLRRSRTCRTRRGKKLELTARDLKIFQCLERYRYLRSAHLYAFVGGASEKRFKERLGDLFHEGYLDRPNQQGQFAGARYQPAIHEIDARGRLALSESGISLNDARTFLASNASRQFAHSLMICEVLASIELGARQYPNIRLIPWPEILARAPDITHASPTPFRVQVPGSGGTAVPDGLFGLEYSGSGKKVYRFFALEADRGTPASHPRVQRCSPVRTERVARATIAAQAHGRSSSRRLLGQRLTSFVSTSASHACGSMLFSLAVSMSEARMAQFTAPPSWPHSKNWGYWPSGGLGLVLVIVLILVLLGRV
jgi:hypothetical protein